MGGGARSFACLVAAYGIGWAGESLARGSEARGAAVRAALLAAPVALPAYVDYHQLRLFAAPDTRTLARAWVESEAENPAVVAAERYSIPGLPEKVVYDLDALSEISRVLCP